MVEVNRSDIIPDPTSKAAILDKVANFMQSDYQKRSLDDKSMLVDKVNVGSCTKGTQKRYPLHLVGLNFAPVQ
jgi:hypothetical protein